MTLRPSPEERRENRQRMFDESMAAVKTYGWWLTPFSKFNRLRKVGTAVLLYGVADGDEKLIVQVDDSLASKHSRGGGGPSALIQPPLTLSKPQPSTLVGPGGKGKGSPPRARKSSKPGGKARAKGKKCPKGQYWSFKQKKCVKSKFR